MEWRLPDRVLHQFGHLPSTNVASMDPSFKRVDDRDKVDTDWVQHRQQYIILWEACKDHIVVVNDTYTDSQQSLQQYMIWFRS